MSRHNIFLISVWFALLTASIDSNAGEVILDTQGNGSRVTRSFETNGPWLLSWRINSDFRDQAGFELNLLNADTGFFDSRILLVRNKVGNGLKLFDGEGRYQLEIVANFTDWYLKIEQLTEAEAKAYRATAEQ